MKKILTAKLVRCDCDHDFLSVVGIDEKGMTVKKEIHPDEIRNEPKHNQIILLLALKKGSFAL